MSMHTPGPWTTGKCYGHTRVEIVGNGGSRMVASVVDTKHAYNPATDKNELVQCEEGEANARLIALTPQLLAALSKLTMYVATGVLESCDGNKCRELWCAGCMGDETAEKTVSEARAALREARELIAKARGEQS